MLLVKTKVAPSSIEGLGLFTNQFTPAGTHIWRFEPSFDRSFAAEYVESQDETTQAFFKRYAYVSPVSNRFILCADDARFFNHADTPNTHGVPWDGEEEARDVALRDIQPGEELTIDYRVMEGTDEPVF